MKRVMTIMALMIACQAGAAEQATGWSGKGGLGIVSQRGNSETETINISAEMVNNLAKWRHIIGANILSSSENEVDTANRFELLGQTDYKVSEKSYWFGSARYEDDDFSQFENQATLTAGYGRQLLDDERHRLKGELGVGYRRAELRATGVSESDPIIRGRLDYAWALSDNASLTNLTLIESGSDNTFAKNVTALNADIANNFGIKVAYEVRHNTDVTDPANNSDFVTTVNLVYSID